MNWIANRAIEQFLNAYDFFASGAVISGILNLLGMIFDFIAVTIPPPFSVYLQYTGDLFSDDNGPLMLGYRLFVWFLHPFIPAELVNLIVSGHIFMWIFRVVLRFIFWLKGFFYPSAG